MIKDLDHDLIGLVTQYEDEDFVIREVLVKQHMGEENFLDDEGKVFLKRLTSC